MRYLIHGLLLPDDGRKQHVMNPHMKPFLRETRHSKAGWFYLKLRDDVDVARTPEKSSPAELCGPHIILIGRTEPLERRYGCVPS